MGAHEHSWGTVAHCSPCGLGWSGASPDDAVREFGGSLDRSGAHPLFGGRLTPDECDHRWGAAARCLRCGLMIVGQSQAEKAIGHAIRDFGGAEGTDAAWADASGGGQWIARHSCRASVGPGRSARAEAEADAAAHRCDLAAIRLAEARAQVDIHRTTAARGWRSDGSNLGQIALDVRARLAAHAAAIGAVDGSPSAATAAAAVRDAVSGSDLAHVREVIYSYRWSAPVEAHSPASAALDAIIAILGDAEAGPTGPPAPLCCEVCGAPMVMTARGGHARAWRCRRHADIEPTSMPPPSVRRA